MTKQSQRVKLSDIAEIKPGYSFRTRIEDDPDGTYLVLQPSNVGDAGEVDESELACVGAITPRPYHMVDPATVLFVAYGPRNRAYRFSGLPSNTIASSTFYVLKLKETSMSPGYLAWYLNQPPAQAYVEALRGGVSVQMIRRDALGSLEIPLPPVALQDKVAEVARLAAEEERLTRSLLEKRRAFIDQFLLDKIQNG